MLRRIVLIGATGFFGRRLAQHLAAIEGVELVLTSRSEERAQAVAKPLGGGAKITAFAFDRDDASSVARLKMLSPWLVIDASGPFQSASYDLARAAIGLGAHWIDLADARDYLLGFGAALDQIASDSGGVARAGASSTPALSMAVVKDLTRGWERVTASISRSCPVGPAMSARLSFALFFHAPARQSRATMRERQTRSRDGVACGV